MRDERLALVRRELVSLRREKTILLAVATQLFVAAFSSFLVVGLVTLYSPAAAGGAVTVAVGVSGNASADLAPAVGGDPARRVAVYDSREAALEAFRDGDLDAVLHATERPAGDVAVEAVVPEGSFRTTLVVVQVKEALSTFERRRRAALSERLVRAPLSVPPEVGGNPYFGFTYTVLLPLLVTMPVFIAGSVAADSLTEELERGTLELLRVTPLPPAHLVDGKALAAIALAPLQAGAWLALLALNGTTVAMPALVVVLVTALATAAVALGVGLALLTGDRRSAQLLYSAVVLAAFGAAALLPENPANAVAKLAIGSPTGETYAVLAALVVAAVAVYAVVRTAAGRSLSE
ncbi:MAG: ABC transporter permease [Halobacteriaceae archaeon]